MTIIKVKSEHKIILDISNKIYSKNKLKGTLKTLQIIHEETSGHNVTMYVNEIKIGIYTIVLYLPYDSSPKWNRLKDFGDFEISIFERSIPTCINLAKDNRFKQQYWVNKNFFGKLRIKHLIDAIIYCQRLDRLNAFS